MTQKVLYVLKKKWGGQEKVRKNWTGDRETLFLSIIDVYNPISDIENIQFDLININVPQSYICIRVSGEWSFLVTILLEIAYSIDLIFDMYTPNPVSLPCIFLTIILL